MKIYLDLLPEEKKKEIRNKKLFAKIIYNEILFAIPILAFFSILLIINFCQNIRIDALNKNSDLGTSSKDFKELQSYEEKLSSINSKIAFLYRIQENHLNWLGVMKKISADIPENVYINGLTTDNYKISLLGKAKNRENFLEFQKKIENDDCFSNVEVPLSNLVSRENVGFQVNFEVKENCLKNKNQ